MKFIFSSQRYEQIIKLAFSLFIYLHFFYPSYHLQQTIFLASFTLMILHEGLTNIIHSLKIKSIIHCDFLLFILHVLQESIFTQAWFDKKFKYMNSLDLKI
jgi:uncharacterized membrane protein